MKKRVQRYFTSIQNKLSPKRQIHNTDVVKGQNVPDQSFRE